MLSGKSFSDLCKWVHDPRYPHRERFRYDTSSSGDRVFVNGDYLSTLLDRFPYISVKKFVFIIHNTDRSFGYIELQKLLPHALHIYAINTTVTHPTLTPIPIGFVDRQLPVLPMFKGGSSERTIEVYMNFLDGTNATKRSECRRALADDPRVTRMEGRSVAEYFTDLGRSKFVVCPEGTGIDTHRVYESLFCGATPVVLHGPLDHLYERLPVCIVNRWTDPYTIPVGKVFNESVGEYL
jgi:hypothetical protein